jgi:hypothetical protein
MSLINRLRKLEKKHLRLGPSLRVQFKHQTNPTQKGERPYDIMVKFVKPERLET